jgi:hypothetical protein
VRRLALLASVVALALGLGACGGGSGSDGSSSTTAKSTTTTVPSSHAIEATPFGKQVTTVCLASAKRLDSLPRFPNPQFDPLHPKPSELPEIGRYFSAGQLPALEVLVAKLKKVDPPAAYEQRYDEFLAQLDKLVANLKRQATAAKAADTKGFVAAIKDAGGLGLPNAESALGITACYVG